MRYIKTYENHKNQNEYYFVLIDMLQDVFDEFGIVAKSDEEFNDYQYPTHPFWSIRLKALPGKTNTLADDISNMSDVGNNDIDFLIVFNLSNKAEFRNSLYLIEYRFYEQTGISLEIEEENISEVYSDYIIRIVS